MDKIEVEYSTRFLKNLSQLPEKLRRLAVKREEIFKSNPFDPRLETHKLHGKEKEHWAYSIDRKYRIKFMFVAQHCVLYLDIGTHDIYS